MSGIQERESISGQQEYNLDIIIQVLLMTDRQQEEGTGLIGRLDRISQRYQPARTNYVIIIILGERLEERQTIQKKSKRIDTFDKSE